MYYALFDSEGNRITSIVEGVHFTITPGYEIYGEENGEQIVIGWESQTIEPPIPEGYIAISDEDQRLYATNEYIRDQVTGKPVKKPANVPTLAELKAAKWNEIKAERDRREQSGVPYLNKVIDSDTVSVQRISIAVQAAQAAISAGVAFSLDWTCADNTVLTMTACQVVGMAVSLAQYSNQLHQIARGLREQTEAAATLGEIDVIKWPDT